MSWFKRLSLRARMLIAVVAVAGMGTAASSITLGWMAARAQHERVQAWVDTLAAQKALEAGAELNQAMDVARTLGQALEAMREGGQAERAKYDEVLRTVLDRNPMLIGVWTAWEPNALDGRDEAFVKRGPSDDATGRYIPYWNRGSGAIQVEPLLDYDKPGPGDYYLLPLRSGRETLVEPYPYKIGGQEVLITTASVPLRVGGRVVGVAGVDIPLSKIRESVGAVKVLDSGHATLLSHGGLYVADRDAARAGKAMEAGDPHAGAKAAIGRGERWVQQGEDASLGEVTRVYAPVVVGQSTTPWSLALTVVDREAQADARALRIASAAMAAGSLLAVCLLLAVLIERMVVRPLGGEPRAAVEVARRVAEGDLTIAIPVRAGDEASLFAALRQMRERLAAMAREIRQHAEGVATASTQIAQGNQDLSSRTEEQAGALQHTASTMAQLGATVRTNADHASDADRLAQNASAVAVRGGHAVGEVVETMRGISESSRRIADIIATIDGIAFQTNILALNAAVEAARAGEQGRGFAVVAGEVRTLAQRSAEAAKEIKALIQDSAGRVELGAEQVDRAGRTMAEVVAAIEQVTGIVAAISLASREQSSGVAQVGEAVGEMDRSTQMNAALVEETAAAADSLRQQAQRLLQAAGAFRTAAA